MELKEIIAWIKAKMEECDQSILFYECCNNDVGVGIFSKNYTRYKKIFELLKELQKLRAQPKIIYCKECKHCKSTEFSTGRKGFMCMKWILETDSDWYCSRAERETE